jgi:putative ATP-binding cassette transporter
VSGVASIALIALINQGLTARAAGTPGPTWWSFAGLCVVVLAAKAFSETLLIRLGQRLAAELRLRLCRQILGVPLQRMEELGPHRVVALLAEDVGVVTAFVMFLPQLVISAVIAAGCLTYIAALSGPVTLLIVVFTMVGVLTYEIPVRLAIRHLRQAREASERLHRHFRALTEGFKELKLHVTRREAFLSELLEPAVQAVRQHSVTGHAIHAVAATWAHLLFLIVIGFLILGLGPGLQLEVRVLTGCALTVLFMRGPLETILSVLPSLTRARVALSKIDEFGVSLANESDAGTDRAALPTAWERLELIDVHYAYIGERARTGFQLGPLSLRLQRGEVVFLCGGNGSGKTTLAKILCGLYVPTGGEVRVDGLPVTDLTREAYRQYFSVVFSDSYLFDRLLGIERTTVDAEARRYNSRLELEQQVSVHDRAFSTLQLSQGQRKRLALLTAYLEDRDIYLFDEWAADQDPAFRRLFYVELIPELKRQGKTVLAITHDDRFYHCADRIVRLDVGCLVESEPISSLLAMPHADVS